MKSIKVFDGPTPPLTGSEALNLQDLAKLGSSLTGLPVVREVLSDEAFEVEAKQRGLPEGFARINLGYYKASRQNEFSEVDSTLEELIGRHPKTMREGLQTMIMRSQ